MRRPIVGFHRDAESHWAAELACGHRQHTRHDPPLSERPWVLTAEGRAARIGTELDCLLCDRRQVPDGYAPYRRTPVFDERSIPDALQRRHATRRGIWGRIQVTRGALDYFVHPPLAGRERLTPATPGIVLPEVEHHVVATGPVSFYVEFLRRAGAEH